MAKLSVNPFKFGDPVEGEYFLPRPELMQVVRQFLENRIHVVLIGPRRVGKTSFTLNLLKKLEHAGYSTLFVDIFNITSHQDFLHQLVRALNTHRNWISPLKEWIKGMANLRPKLLTEIDPITGHPSFGFTLDLSTEKDVKVMIQDLLTYIGKLGDRVIFAIDEFQKISQIEDQGWLEATLRTHMQELTNTSFLFTGSRKSLIYDMLNNSARPLYRSCQTIEFPAFGAEFTEWVIKRFEEVGIEAQPQAIEHLRLLVQDIPNYVQMVSFHLVTQGIKKVTPKEVEKALECVVRQNAYVYQTLLNTLTPIQQRSLRLAAQEGKNIYAKELLKKYEISTGPALASSIKALKDKGILAEEGTGRGKVIFDDPFLALWLKFSY